MKTPFADPSFAIIDGSLCKLNRRGTPVAKHRPLGAAVVEFIKADNRLIVREHCFGCLPGITNVYCLDEALKLLWLAELPDETSLFKSIALSNDGRLQSDSNAGHNCIIDISTGRILEKTPPGELAGAL